MTDFRTDRRKTNGNLGRASDVVLLSRRRLIGEPSRGFPRFFSSKDRDDAAVLAESGLGSNEVNEDAVSSGQEGNLLPEVRALAWLQAVRTRLMCVREDRLALGASPCGVAMVVFHHDVAGVADLTVSQGIDHFLWSGGDLVVLRHASLYLVGESLVVGPHRIVEDRLQLRIET